MRKLTIIAKCSDGYIAYYESNGESFEFDGRGYLSLKGIASGEYIEISIDLDTGKIGGYEPVSDEKVKKDFPRKKTKGEIQQEEMERMKEAEGLKAVEDLLGGMK